MTKRNTPLSVFRREERFHILSLCQGHAHQTNHRGRRRIPVPARLTNSTAGENDPNPDTPQQLQLSEYFSSYLHHLL